MGKICTLKKGVQNIQNVKVKALICILNVDNLIKNNTLKVVITYKNSFESVSN